MRPAIRPVELADAAVLAELLGRNRAFMAPWDAAREDEFFTAEWQTGEVQGLLDAREQGTALPYVILDEAGSTVGRIVVRHVVRGAAQSGTLGYWVAQEANGRGYATRAVAAVLDAAFGEAGLHRVQAETLVHNVRSRRVLEKNGFERIGVAPDFLRIAGRWQDHLLWQRLAEDPTADGGRA